MNPGLPYLKVHCIPHMTLSLKADEQGRNEAKPDPNISGCRLLTCLKGVDRWLVKKHALKCIINTSLAVTA